MIRISLLLLVSAALLLFAFHLPGRKPDIRDVFPLQWKARTGMACFRTNVVLDDQDLIMGSNGGSFMDWNITDAASGVYVIDRRTGRVKSRAGNELIGDMDVNGVLLHEGLLYFGNDNEEFLCTRKDGTIVWQKPASGDIEHEPVLLSDGQRKLVVYASESGEVTAADPVTGKTFWKYYTPDYSGWKPGQSRKVFKVKAYFSNTLSFFTKPVLMDCNKDSVADLVYQTFNSGLYVINGRNGKLLWKTDAYTNLQYAPSVIAYKGKSYIGIINVSYENQAYQSYFLLFSPEGKLKHQILLDRDYFNAGLNNLTTGDGSAVYVSPTKFYRFRNTDSLQPVQRSSVFTYGNQLAATTDSFVRSSYQPVLGTAVFPFRGHPECIAVINQRNTDNWEQGSLEIVSLKGWMPLLAVRLPMAAEMPPVIADINQDGRLDILVNCTDSYTYCLTLK